MKKHLMRRFYHSAADNHLHGTHDLLAEGVEREQARLRRELGYLKAAVGVYTGQPVQQTQEGQA
jgi:hypothetical protein